MKLHDAFKTRSNFYLVTEVCNGGDLLYLNRVRGHLKENEARIILLQIIEGLQYLYGNNIVHRDIKLANILLHFPETDLLNMNVECRKRFLRKVDLCKVKFSIKIADMGLATELDYAKSRALTVCGTPLYMSPEIDLEQSYDFKVDIWALGVVYYELLTGITPF